MESLLNQRFPMAPNPHALKKLNIFLTTVSRPHVIYRLKKKNEGVNKKEYTNPKFNIEKWW